MNDVSTFRFAFDALGTAWEIDTSVPLLADIRDRIRALIDRFDSVYSRFREDSIITRIAGAAEGGSFEFPSDAAPMFDLYDRLHAATDGAVDPLVGRDLELFGYDRLYSLIPDESAIAAVATRRPSWSQEVRRKGGTVTTRMPVVIDLGAVGKGRLVDLIAEVLKTEGIDDFMIDGSGDIIHRGDRAVPIGLEHPFDSNLVIGVANMENASLCASASNRRRWADGLHHVLDGRNGRPTRDVTATWAIATDTATADGLATALFFDAVPRLMNHFEFSFVRMFADGHVEVSDNFDGEVFT